MNILVIAGARPNFMKVAPLMEAFAASPHMRPLLVHTGQHYDQKMSELFFRDLGIPEPNVNLGVGSGSQSWQTAEIMKRFEPVVLEQNPDGVVVVGDVNSTLACALVAVKLGIPLAHVEAGLRSGDRRMPEEINRRCTDAVSDLLFCTEQSGVDHLRAEGIEENRIFLVGNVMVDTLLKHRHRAEQSTVLETLGLNSQHYGLLTLHRPGNVEHAETLSGLIDALEHISQSLPVVFPVHPRTHASLERTNLLPRMQSIHGIRLIEPLGYLDFLKLMSHARVILTDSGGIQEEATVLQKPCLTLRNNTERPITITMGTNRLVGTDPSEIIRMWNIVDRGEISGCCPPLWDGQAARRIQEHLIDLWNRA